MFLIASKDIEYLKEVQSNLKDDKKIEADERLCEILKNIDLEKLEIIAKENVLELITRNIAAWETSKDKSDGLLPEVYNSDLYIFEKLTGLNPRKWSNLKKHAPGLGDKCKI